MKRPLARWTMVFLLGLWALPMAAWGAGPATQPDTAAAPGKPAGAVDVTARVVLVEGSAVYRPAGATGQFKPITKGLVLAADTTVSTGAKARVGVQFGDNSGVLIEQLSILTIQQVYEKQVAGAAKPTTVTRLKLVNGSVRAAVERGRTDNDFQISTPVATLSVRGTVLWMSFDAGTGYFEAGTTEGSIKAKVTPGDPGTVEIIEGGEWVNSDLWLAVLMAQFLYHTQLGDPWGSTMQEYIVEVFNENGLGNFGGGDPQEILNDLVKNQQVTLADDDAGGADDDVFFDDDAIGGTIVSTP